MPHGTCPLCLNTRHDINKPPNKAGDWRKLYDVVAKYFHPICDQSVNDFTALCGDCWRQILSFYSFQLTVFGTHKQKRQMTPIPRESDQCKVVVIKTDTSQKPNFVQQKNQFAPVKDRNNTMCHSSTPKKISIVDSPRCSLQSDRYDNFTNHLQTSAVAHSSPLKSPREISPLKSDNLNGTLNRKLECYECHKIFPTVTLLERHFRRNHPQKGFYILCCGRKLKRRWIAENHLQFHLNVNTRKCRVRVCRKLYTN